MCASRPTLSPPKPLSLGFRGSWILGSRSRGVAHNREREIPRLRTSADRAQPRERGKRDCAKPQPRSCATAQIRRSSNKLVVGAQGRKREGARAHVQNRQQPPCYMQGRPHVFYNNVLHASHCWCQCNYIKVPPGVICPSSTQQHVTRLRTQFYC